MTLVAPFPYLELVTASENIAHSYANGRLAPWSRAGTWRGKPRISQSTKDAMRAARMSGQTLADIAAAFGCSVAHAQRITGRKGA